MKQLLRDLWDLYDKSTQGEWTAKQKYFYGIVAKNEDGYFNLAGMNESMPNWRNDQDFILKTHNLFPKLLKAIELSCERYDELLKEKFFQNPSEEYLKQAAQFTREIEKLLGEFNGTKMEKDTKVDY